MNVAAVLYEYTRYVFSLQLFVYLNYRIVYIGFLYVLLLVCCFHHVKCCLNLPCRVFLETKIFFIYVIYLYMLFVVYLCISRSFGQRHFIWVLFVLM